MQLAASVAGSICLITMIDKFDAQSIISLIMLNLFFLGGMVLQEEMKKGIQSRKNFKSISNLHIWNYQNIMKRLCRF